MSSFFRMKFNVFLVFGVCIFLVASFCHDEASADLTIGAYTTVIAGHLSNTGTDSELEIAITRDLPGVPLSAYIYRNGGLISTLSTTTDANGDFQFSGTEQYVADSEISVQVKVYFKTSRIQVRPYGGGDYSETAILSYPFNTVKSVELNNGKGWQLANAIQLVNWVISENLYASSPSILYVYVGNGTYSGSDSIYVSDDNHIGAFGHELGHIILRAHGVDDFGDSRGDYPLPDGTNKDSDTRPLLVLHEDWADFFGAAVLQSLYPSTYNSVYFKGRIELNTGGRDVYVGSEVAYANRPNNYVGIQTDPDGVTYAVYPYNYNEAYSKSGASFLWDFFDGTAHNQNVWTISWVGNDAYKKWLVSFDQRLDRIVFHDSAYSAKKSSGYFTSSAMYNRELAYDNVQVSLDKLLSAIAYYGNDVTKDVRTRLDLRATAMGVSGYAVDQLERLHATSNRLRSALNSLYFIRHQNGVAKATTLSSSQDEWDAEWKLVPSLADFDNQQYVSIESINYPGTYLRHKSGLIYQERNDGSSLFENDATWKVTSTSSKYDKSITLESINYPGYYLTVSTLGDHPLVLGHENSYSYNQRLFYLDAQFVE